MIKTLLRAAPRSTTSKGGVTRIIARSVMEFFQFADRRFTAKELLLQDIDKEAFHSCWDDLYTEVTHSNKLTTDRSLCNKVVSDPSWTYVRTYATGKDRLIGKFPLYLNEKTLWTPMLIDTGSPGSFICKETLERFNAPVKPRLQIQIDKMIAQASVLSDEDSEKYPGFGNINILGMDILLRMVPTLGKQVTQGHCPKPRPSEDIILTYFRDENSISNVFNMIASVQGSRYTKEMQAAHIRVLHHHAIFSVTALRIMSTEDIRALPLPVGILSFLIFIKDGRQEVNIE